MLKKFICLLLPALVLFSFFPPAMADDRGGDPYVVTTNYHYDEELQEGYFEALTGKDPDPGRGYSYTPQYNDYDWMITDPVGIRQSELDAFTTRCADYAFDFGINGIEIRSSIYNIESGLNAVQLVPNAVVKRNSVYLSGSFSIFFPPNYDPDPSNRYPIVVQIPGFSTNSLNEMIFDPGGNSLPLGFYSSIKSYANDPNHRGVVYIVWNAGGYNSIGANSDSRAAISWLIRNLRIFNQCDPMKVIVRGSSRGAFAALTMAENIIHGEEIYYGVIGVFATSPPLSMGTLSGIPVSTNPDLANLYQTFVGTGAYLYSGSAPPGSSPQPALEPTFGTTDPLAADQLCPDYDGSAGGTDNVDRLQGKYVYLAAGTHDSFFPVTHFLGLDRKLSERGINHTTFLVLQGGHGPTPKSRQDSIFIDFIYQVMANPKFDPAAYTPPAPYKHGLWEDARNYLLDTDLETHQPTDATGQSTMKTLFLRELPFSATMPRRLGCDVYGDGPLNVADEPGIVHLTGAAGSLWELYLFNPTNSDLTYRSGIFDSNETADLTWWGDLFPVSAAGHCGVLGACTPGNDWLQWSALYNGDHATGNTNYMVGGNRIALETEIIDHQAAPWESRVLPYSPNSPSVALGVDLFPPLVAEMRCSHTSGTAPFTPYFSFTLANNSEYYRRLAFRIDTTLANGYFISNHRAGYANVEPYDRFEIGLNMTLPTLPSLNGDNVFALLTEDVTPAPYNQPPYPAAGGQDTHSVTVSVVVP